MSGVLVYRDVNNISSVFSAFVTFFSLHILRVPLHFILYTVLEGSQGENLICRIDSYIQLSVMCISRAITSCKGGGGEGNIDGKKQRSKYRPLWDVITRSARREHLVSNYY